jgi:hypothetical protein
MKIALESPATSKGVDHGPKAPARHPYILTMRLPDAQFFNAEYGISYAQSLLAPLKVKIDKSFKIGPALDPAPDAQGIRWVTYILRSEMSASQARAVRQRPGFTVERERTVHASGRE